MCLSADDFRQCRVLTYNGGDDENAEDAHESIETAPPSSILVAGFIDHPKPFLQVMRGTRFCDGVVENGSRPAR